LEEELAEDLEGDNGDNPSKSNDMEMGPPFMFAEWKKTGEGSLTHFEHAITINAVYNDHKVTSSGQPEEHVRLYMYYPGIQAWVPVGGDLDIYKNVVSGLVSNLYPFVVGPYTGQTLFRVALAQPIPLETTVAPDGTTSFAFGPTLDVPPGTVAPGSHFDFGVVRNLPQTNYTVVGKAYVFGAYFIDRSADVSAPDKEFTHFSNPLTLTFAVPEDLPEGLGAVDAKDLTIVTVSPETGKWVDIEDLGHEITYGRSQLSVDIDFGGVFALALRQPVTEE
jgi:hypothetical protein